MVACNMNITVRLILQNKAVIQYVQVFTYFNLCYKIKLKRGIGMKNKVWKIILSIFTSILVLSCIGYYIYNSDWCINKTMNVKSVENVQLSKILKYSYSNKYENGQLKVTLTLYNVDDEIMNLARKELEEKAWLMKIYFCDKENYKLAELNLPIGDFVHYDKGVYSVQGTIAIDKKTIKKVKFIQSLYREFLNFKYKDLMNKYWTEYNKAMDNLFSFL